MSKAYAAAVMYIEAGYDIDVAIFTASLYHRLDEFQAEDLEIRINKHFANKE